MIPAHTANATLTNGITRKARPRQCHCGTWTLVGLDHPRCAGEATTDLQPLNPLGEALTILTGKTTYTLTRQAGHLVLDHRDQWAIKTHPPETGPFDTLAEHTCHHPPPTAGTTTTRIPKPHTAQETPNDPPF